MTEQSTAAISGGPQSPDQDRGETQSGTETKSSSRMTRVRWLMAFLCFAGLAINYIDRANLSVALPFVTKDFHLDPIQAGLLLGAFSWTYTAFQVPGGWLIDRFGAKVMFPIAVGLWSIFTIVTAFCTGFTSFFIARLGLGIGESGAYPASAKVVSTWFPASERGKATAFYDSGARIGSALAVPIVAFIIAGYGWQAAFIITGLLGLLWVLGWLVVYRDPEQHRKVNSAELDHIRSTETADDGAAVEEIPGFRWWHLFRYRAVWAMMIGFFCINFVITFFLTWFPSYLIQERGFDLLKVGMFGAIPGLCSILGGFASGIYADRLIRRGATVTRARKTCLVVGMLGSSVIALAVVVPNAALALALLSLSYAFLVFAMVALWCLPADFAPSARQVASLGGIQNGFGNIASILSPVFLGILQSITGSFALPLIIAGIVAVAGAACFAFLLPKVQPLEIKAKASLL
jgi:ACS family D-galactonate transporter-like MFS transporter